MPRWFRRKTLGYGWTPASWEGWLATLLMVFACLGLAGPELVELGRMERMVCELALVACYFVLILATSGGNSGD